MHPLRKSSIVAPLLVLALFGLVVAQEKPNEREQQPTGLSLEINTKEGPTGFQSVPGSSFGGRYRRIAGWAPTPSYPQPRTLAMTNEVEGDAVRVKVFAVMDRFHEQKVLIGNFLLREGEKATVEEMTNYGYEPMEITVVRIKPATHPPPIAESRVPSVEAVSVEALPTNFPSYKVTYRNLSAKEIVYLEIQSFRNGRPGILQWPREEYNRPLIKPGETASVKVSAYSAGLKAPDGYTPSTSERIEVLTAVFSDKSYEGNSRTAMGYLAMLRGQKIQLQRALPLMQSAAEADDARAALSSLEQQVNALGRDVSQEMIDGLSAEVQDTTPQAARILKSYMEGGLDQARKELLRDVGEYAQAARFQSFSSSAFKTWLNNLRQKYEAWLSRL